MAKAINQTMANVKDLRDTPSDVAFASERAGRRLVLLVDELLREMEHARGSQMKVARMFEMDQGTLSKLLSKERTTVGLHTVERARKALNLKHEYFHGTREPRSYHDYIGGDLDAPYEAWGVFLETETGKSMSADERATLASTRFAGREPTAVLYQIFLLTMRGQIHSSDRDRVIADNERLDRENAEDDEDPSTRRRTRR